MEESTPVTTQDLNTELQKASRVRGKFTIQIIKSFPQIPSRLSTQEPVLLRANTPQKNFSEPTLFRVLHVHIKFIHTSSLVIDTSFYASCKLQIYLCSKIDDRNS